MSVRDGLECDGLEKEPHEIRGPDAHRELIRPDEPAESLQRPQPVDEQRSQGEARADLRQQVGGDWEPREFEAPRAELGRFNLERAALPSLGIDGLRPNDQLHRCRSTATRIDDPDAFATALIRGAEHPKVRAALDMSFDSGRRPKEVTVPIAELLGPDGHRHCTGWRLEPVEESMDAARTNRDAWITAKEQGQEADVPEPRARPVPTFKGGVITFLFEPNDIKKHYEIVTMFPRPDQRHVVESRSGAS